MLPTDTGGAMCEPSLTLIWVLEYPLVTFLTLLITRDMMGGRVVGSGRTESQWAWV